MCESLHETVSLHIYAACATFLDFNKPQVEIAGFSYPLFLPKEEGEVSNVCFLRVTESENDTLHIYSGAADERKNVAYVNLEALIEKLKLNKN